MISNKSGHDLRMVRHCMIIILWLTKAVHVIGNDQGFYIGSDALCQIWWAGNTCKIMKSDAVPGQKGKISIKAARNEREGFQVILQPKQALHDVSVTISDFRHRHSDALIAAGNVTIRKVEYVNVTRPSGTEHQKGWYPDPLPLLEQPFYAEAHINTPVWFSVNVPGDAMPGRYQATIQFTAGRWNTEIPVELEVWNFALPLTPHMRSAFGLYSGMIRQYHNLSSDVEMKSVLDKYYSFFRDYRISPQNFSEEYPVSKKVTGADWSGGTYDPDTVYQGRYAYQVHDGNVRGNSQGQFCELIRIDPSHPYLLKWVSKTLKNNQPYAVTIQCYTSSREPIPWQLKGMICNGSTSWKTDSVLIDPVKPLAIEDMIVSRPFPPEAAFASVHLYPVIPDEGGTTTGTIWFDSFRFIDIHTGENLIPRGDFEQEALHLNVEVDFTEFDKAARKYLDTLGFTGFRVKLSELRPGPYWGSKKGWFAGFIDGTPEYQKLINLYLGEFQQHLKENGWLGKEYMYWVDEPKHEDYAFVRRGMEIIHQAAPGLTRFITENNPGPEIMDVTEIGCPVLAKFDPLRSQSWIEEGRQMWSYLMTWPKNPHVNLFIDADAINMRMWLWMSYQYNLTGILVWCSNFWNAEGCSPKGVLQNIWDDPMSYWDGNMLPHGAAAEYGNGDGMFIYPPNRDPNHDKTKYLTGPVPSLRLEILREGIDDYDYMIMLEQCVQNAESGQASLVRKARLLLNFVPGIFTDEQHYVKDPEVIMRVRNQMGELLQAFAEIDQN